MKHLNFDVELLGDCDIIISELCHKLGDGWQSLKAGAPLTQILKDEMVTPPALMTVEDNRKMKDFTSDNRMYSSELAHGSINNCLEPNDVCIEPESVKMEQIPLKIASDNFQVESIMTSSDTSQSSDFAKSNLKETSVDKHSDFSKISAFGEEGINGNQLVQLCHEETARVESSKLLHTEKNQCVPDPDVLLWKPRFVNLSQELKGL